MPYSYIPKCTNESLFSISAGRLYLKLNKKQIFVVCFFHFARWLMDLVFVFLARNEVLLCFRLPLCLLLFVCAYLKVFDYYIQFVVMVLPCKCTARWFIIISQIIRNFSCSFYFLDCSYNKAATSPCWHIKLWILYFIAFVLKIEPQIEKWLV